MAGLNKTTPVQKEALVGAVEKSKKPSGLGKALRKMAGVTKPDAARPSTVLSDSGDRLGG